MRSRASGIWLGGSIFFLLSLSGAMAATLQGTIYDAELNVATAVLVEINTTPLQKMLAVDGTYSFAVPQGTYTLQARKGDITVNEEVHIAAEGTFTLDLFLLPDFLDEDELWQESEEPLFEEEKSFWSRAWRYGVAAVILIFAIWRIRKARKRYGPLPSLFRWRRKGKLTENREEEERKKEEAPKKEKESTEMLPSPETGSTLPEHVLSILRKHDGRMTQKELRKELMHLSEAKVSLLLTELEHREKIDKIKRGRGNVIVVKESSSP